MDWGVLKLLFGALRWRLLLPTMLVVFSALAVCYVVQNNRKAYDRLQQTYAQRNDAEVRWGQLLLQYGTLTSYGRIEALAKKKLHMLVPDQKNIILVKP